LINFSAVRADTFTGKIVRYPFRVLRRDLVVRILQGPLRGRKWIVGSFLHGCWLGSYELEFQKLLAREVKPGGVFYDIGANVGFYSLLAALLVGPGHVYAFEPLPGNLIYFHKHMELNDIRNVELTEVAVSDEVGTAPFFLEETRGMGNLGPGGSINVQTTTLDALLHDQKMAPPDYIKMDIEGGEYRALRGAVECFARYRPTLFLATHGSAVHNDCCQLLDEWGYQVQIVRQTATDRAEILARPKVQHAR
jgi:FkbM family methyltransferase